jgi:hypothetical protein
LLSGIAVPAQNTAEATIAIQNDRAQIMHDLTVGLGKLKTGGFRQWT